MAGNLGGRRVLARQPSKCRIDVEHQVGVGSQSGGLPFQRQRPRPAAAFSGLAAAGVVDQAPLYRHGRGAEKAAAVGNRRLAEPEVRLMDQSRRVERVPGTLARKSRGQPFELVVGDREEAAGAGSPRSIADSMTDLTRSDSIAIGGRPVEDLSPQWRNQTADCLNREKNYLALHGTRE
jgi:hypothetical protein